MGKAAAQTWHVHASCRGVASTAIYRCAHLQERSLLTKILWMAMGMVPARHAIAGTSQQCPEPASAPCLTSSALTDFIAETSSSQLTLVLLWPKYKRAPLEHEHREAVATRGKSRPSIGRRASRLSLCENVTQELQARSRTTSDMVHAHTHTHAQSFTFNILYIAKKSLQQYLQQYQPCWRDSTFFRPPEAWAGPRASTQHSPRLARTLR